MVNDSCESGDSGDFNEYGKPGESVNQSVTNIFEYSNIRIF